MALKWQFHNFAWWFEYPRTSPRKQSSQVMRISLNRRNKGEQYIHK